MFILFLVGSVFITFSGLFYYKRKYFISNGEKLLATVVGIERYKSTHRSGSSRSTYTMYRPVIKYQFKGKNYYFCGNVGSSKIDYRIGQNIYVYSLPQGPEYVTLAKSQVDLLIKIFAIGGISCFGFGIYLTLKDFHQMGLFSVAPLILLICVWLLYIRPKIKSIKQRVKEGIPG